MTEPIDPDLLEQVEFSVVRRGVDPVAVRSTLAEAADGLRLLKRRCHELEHRLETLEAEIPDPDQIDKEREAARVEGRSEGEAAGERQRAEAGAEAEALIAEAKEEGRRLVGEAQMVRRRMLEDLARRRRALRQQIEQLRGGRERLLEAYEVVGHTMREATAELSAALPEARAAAERAGHGVGPEETVEQLEAEIESGRLAGLPIIEEQERPDRPAPPAPPRPRPVAVPLERDVRDMPEVEPLVADFEEVRVLPEGADLDEGAMPEEPRPDPDVVDDPEIDGSDVEPGGDDRSGATADAPVADEDAVPADPSEGQPPESDHGGEDRSAVGDARDDDAEGPDGADDADGADGADGDDLFARLRRSREEAEHADPSDAAALSAAEVDPPDASETAPSDDAAADAGAAESADSGAEDELDHPDDAAEPFGLVLGADGGDPSPRDPATAERVSAEHALARILKRLLSDEQNDVLDRLRRTRKRTITVDDLLDELDDRVTRFAQAVEPVLADAAEVEAGPDVQPVDDLAAELAREVAEALADGMVEPLEEGLPPDELAGPVRSLYRSWKTDRISALAKRYVEAACEPTRSAI